MSHKHPSELCLEVIARPQAVLRALGPGIWAIRSIRSAVLIIIF